MNLEHLKDKIWLGKDSFPDDIVISSRIRLARNLFSNRFPKCAEKQERLAVSKTLSTAIKKLKFLKNLSEFSLSQMSELEKIYFMERHLISREHATELSEKSFLLTEDESLSFMINEEDHLRTQILMKSYNLEKSWDILNKIDTELMNFLDFAFSEKYGFLTECPTNIGTGMRASVMLHLPALVLSQKDKKLFSTISQMGIAIRGLYGEGSGIFGYLFQISNQLTLGHSEKEILKRLKSVVDQILRQEKALRESLLLKKRKVIEDKVYRAWGILLHSRMLSFSESIELLSLLWLGMSLQLISGMDRNKFFELFFLVKPAHIQIHFKKSMSPQERDIKRAEMIRKQLGSQALN